MTARLREWQARLAACLAERAARPFAWGVHDCCMFAADCVDACTGADPAADLRGAYADAAGALQVVQGLGGLPAIAAARLGAEIAPALAQVGDVAVLPAMPRHEGDPVVQAFPHMLAVWGGAMWLAPWEVGYVALPADQALQAWRIVSGEG
jgi:hypothetical protein